MSMAGGKLLTVVIPVFNREHILGRTLNSVARQNLERVNVVIVNNASTDHSRDVALRWCREHSEIRTLVVDQPVAGAAAARNAGLAHVSTPYVMFFDSDDEMLPGHLAMVVEGIEHNPGAQLLGWEVALETAGGRRKRGRFSDRNALVTHLIHATMSTQRYVAATALVRRVGGWNERMLAWNDYELGVRLLLAAGNPVRLNRNGAPTVQINFTEESITGRRFSTDTAKWELSLQAVEHELGRCRPDLLGWVDYRRAVLAAEYAREGDAADAHRLLALATCRSRRNSLMARLVYCCHRYVGRGSWLIASLFLPRG